MGRLAGMAALLACLSAWVSAQPQPGPLNVPVPKVVRHVDPVFPAIPGDYPAVNLVFDVFVDADGHPTEVRSRRDFQGFDGPARQALMQWEFAPVRQWGRTPTGVVAEIAVPFVTHIFVNVYRDCSAAARPGLSDVQRNYCAGTAQAHSGASGRTVPPAAPALVAVPAGLRKERHLQALVTPYLPYFETPSDRALAEIYALGIASYLDPTARRLEEPRRERSPLVDSPDCAALIKTSTQALPKLVKAAERALADAARPLPVPSVVAAATAHFKGWADAGFADAHLMMSQPQSGCQSPLLQQLYASVAKIADGRYSDRPLIGSTTARITAGHLRPADPSAPDAAAAAAALAAAGFDVLECQYKDVEAPIVLWHMASPATRSVRGLGEKTTTLGIQALGTVALDACPDMHEIAQRAVAAR
ncbi:MAG: hypothetical protein U0Q12_06295 [Vicinamibacterales bacterium]